MKNESETKIPLKAYPTKELAKFYKVSEKIFRSWLVPYKDKIGKKVGHFYTPKQVRIIFEEVGFPEM